jgi:hypothetical protein
MRLLTGTLVLLLTLTTVCELAIARGGDKPRSTKYDFELGDLVDVPLFFETLPDLEALRLESRKLQIHLHNLAMKLGEAPEPAEEKRLRGLVQVALQELRQVKRAHVNKVNPVLRHEKANLSETDILIKLRDTSLGSVDWEDKYFKDCIELIQKRTGIRFFFNPAKVNKFNGVWMRIPDVSASCALRFICHGFDLKWMIYEGDIYITRKIDRNEDRWRKYEDSHGKVDYWKKEQDELMKIVDGRRVPQTIVDLDLDLLRQNLLKFFILEEESQIHQLALKRLKFEQDAVEQRQLALGDPKYMKMAKDRERAVRHFLWLEREGAIEVMSIVYRILGDKTRLTDAKSEWLGILETPISDIAWKALELDRAMADLGSRVGVEVVCEMPLTQIPFITLSMERGTLETAISVIREIHPIQVVYKKGKIYVFLD